MSSDAVPSPASVPDGVPATSPARTSVAILGSCITRDVFNRRFCPDHHARYRIAASGYRIALPSLMGRPVQFEDALLEGLSAQDRTWVRNDATKAFLDDLAADPPEILLVDLAADVRFGVLDLGGGAYLTAFRWMYRRTAWWNGLDPARRPRTIAPLINRAEYLRLWTGALERLREHVARVAPATRVVVVRARQTRCLWLPEQTRTVPLRDHRFVPPGSASRFDAAWDELTGLALASTGWRAIDMRPREYPTSDSHPWRAGQTHFAPDYYEDLLASLDRLQADPSQAAVTQDGTRPPGRSWDGEPGASEPRPRPPRPAQLARRHRPLRKRIHHRLGRLLGSRV